MNIILVVIVLFMSLVFAAPQAEIAPEKAKAPENKNGTSKSTDMAFDELLIQGKYHFTDEAVTTVEQDKVLDGLLEVRKDFKDRIQQSTTRY